MMGCWGERERWRRSWATRVIGSRVREREARRGRGVFIKRKDERGFNKTI
jgi:hypothetical protein